MMSRSDRYPTSNIDINAWPQPRDESEPARSKYHREIKPGVWVDVYSVLVAFGVTNPADAHAIKKLLMPGMRGHKDGVQDRREAIASIQRAIEIEEGKEFVK